MYSLSTCWNSARHTDGRAMLREIRELGFEYAELSHGIRLSLVPGILDAVKAGEIKISTLHNFCPLPVGINGPSPNLYEFSSDRDRDRQLAFKHTRNTLEFAVRVGAPLVVLHFGSMDLKDYTGKLKELLERGKRGTLEFRKLTVEAEAARAAKKQRFYDHARAVLRELVGEAKTRGLKFGLEIREAVEELPVESDFSSLLEEFPAPTVYYWHDTGHAQIKQELGFIEHAQFLGERAARLAGFHIHDVKFPARDHFPPGGGDIDFAALAPWVKPEHIKVFELSPKVPVEAARAGIAHLKQLWGAEWGAMDEPIELPIDGVLDLHTFQPREVKDLVPEYLAACQARGILHVRIIHGKGIGNLRRTVQAILQRHPAVISFTLDYPQFGGWGATRVELRRTTAGQP